MKKKLTQLTTLCFMTALMLVLGCTKGPERPSDLPKLFPCTITVTQEGQPLPESGVFLESVDSSAKYKSSSGITNTEGVVSFRTFGFDGVPAGKYKIVVRKTAEEGGVQQETSPNVFQMINTKTYSLVKKEFSSAATSPLEIEIKETPNTQTVDVGAAVRDLVRTNSP